jgi:hypothetical protein
VQPRLLPDGTPDVHYRTACGGQKLRDIMLDNYIDLYGPYVSHPLARLLVVWFGDMAGPINFSCFLNDAGSGSAQLLRRRCVRDLHRRGKLPTIP